MHVTFRLFASLRDRAGVDHGEFDLPENATVSALIRQLSVLFPQIEAALPTTLVAINQEYAFPEDELHSGDEVALFPPVSGGSGTAFPLHLAVTSEILDVDAICATITRPETGAVCIFSGAVRGKSISENRQQTTSYLEYEAYEPMAEKVLRQVADEIRKAYPKVQGVAIVQRIGRLEVGETTILVACSAGHRHDGCFEAARYGIDRVKEIVPVWKKEVGPVGEMWVEGYYHPSRRDGSRELARSAEGASHESSDTPFVIGCSECGETYPFDTHLVKCACGNPFSFSQSPEFRRDGIEDGTFSVWRYRSFLVPNSAQPVTLGEGWTPLVEIDAFERSVHLKMECLNPSGAFKDRGAAVLVSVLKGQGVTSVHDDSSGNAGAALAAYCTAAGLQAKLFVPKSAAGQKLAQIRLYGAALEAIDGPRSEAARAAEEAAQQGDTFYASHIYNPFSVFAYKSIAYELWEQLGERAPDAVVLPLGHGSQLLGIAKGFEDLLASGLIEQLPRLYGVQAAVCAPIWATQRGQKPNFEENVTLAEGIRIVHPVRAKEVLRAIRRSQGDILVADESEIIKGVRELARRGVMTEPTSAVVWPALEQLSPRMARDAIVVLSITGSGQKVPGLDALVGRNQDH